VTSGESTLRHKSTRDGFLIVFLAFLLRFPLWCENWVFLGPDGGDARSLAYDLGNPDHLLLGTSTGTIFASTNGGETWSRLAHLGEGDNYVLDHIIIDPRNSKVLFVSAWDVKNQKSGDIFRSRDGGATWVTLPGMHQKSVRALGMAPSDSNVLVAGAFDGVYRSDDAGDSWQRISPPDHAEIKNIESIAIDPRNSNVIYGGTWHLAWKTTDGGVSWHHIHKGMVDDSDVFSIIVDPATPAVVYASACSGIYKSENAGEDFHKIQGIPFGARRTRILKQDPNNSRIIYAGTTRGLWKTTDSAKTWKLVTRPTLVVNEVLVDPRNSSRLLLATDRTGIMVSDNGGKSFSPSNRGYTHRYITTILADKNDPETIYVGVANDHEWGGVFCFRFGSNNWQQNSNGLEGRDVFVLKRAVNGTLVAGTNRGLFTLDVGRKAWISDNGQIEKSGSSRQRRGEASGDRSETGSALTNVRINDIEVESEEWFAATSVGLFASANKGKTWKRVRGTDQNDFVAVETAGDLLVAATHTNVFVSIDQGNHWKLVMLPERLRRVTGIAIISGARILVASTDHILRSSDSGTTWERIAELPAKNLSSISYDESRKTVLVTSLSTGTIVESSDAGTTWSRGPNAGQPLRRIKVFDGRLVAVTPFEGVIVQQ
jgi:photosystem II stability/assembly factor-like uncharacterized protein